MILITGGAGYIGSHTALEFLKNNFSIVIFDNLENGHIATVNFLKAQGNVTFEQGDLKNFEDINKVFDKYEIAPGCMGSPEFKLPKEIAEF